MLKHVFLRIFTPLDQISEDLGPAMVGLSM